MTIIFFVLLSTLTIFSCRRPNPNLFGGACERYWHDPSRCENMVGCKYWDHWLGTAYCCRRGDTPPCDGPSYCIRNKDCFSGICINNNCGKLGRFDCVQDDDCIEGYCMEHNKKCLRYDGYCVRNENCRDGICVRNVICSRVRNGLCDQNWKCPPDHLCYNTNRCNERLPIDGRPFIVEGRSRTTTSQICSSSNVTNAESWKMGEAPLVQASNLYNQEIGRLWLRQAEAEHASVASFARHTLQLMSIGAPSRLLVASQEASVDEIKHAKMCYGFASAFIGSNFGPGSLDVNLSLDSMDLKDIIRSLIIEGCIGETLSAIEAHLAAHNAEDTAVKAAVSEIASDETKHAQLAWDTIKWIIEKYPDSRTFADDIFYVELEQRKRSSINDSTLIPAKLCEDSEKDNSIRRYGLLVPGDRDKISEAGIRDVIEPIYLAGFKSVNMISKQIIELDMATLSHVAGFQDIIEPASRAKFNDVDMISKQITELDSVTL